MNFEKELNEIVERDVEEIKKQSKAKSIDEFLKDEATVFRLNRIYNTRDLLTELYYGYEKDTGLNEKIKTYGLDRIFIEVYDVNNYYIKYYTRRDDMWLTKIITDLDLDFPIWRYEQE